VESRAAVYLDLELLLFTKDAHPVFHHPGACYTVGTRLSAPGLNVIDPKHYILECNACKKRFDVGWLIQGAKAGKKWEADEIAAKFWVHIRPPVKQGPATVKDMASLKVDPKTEIYHKGCGHLISYEAGSGLFVCSKGDPNHPRWFGYIDDEQVYDNICRGGPPLKDFLAEHFYVHVQEHLEMVHRLYFDDKLGCTLCRPMTQIELEEFYNQPKDHRSPRAVP